MTTWPSQLAMQCADVAGRSRSMTARRRSRCSDDVGSFVLERGRELRQALVRNSHHEEGRQHLTAIAVAALSGERQVSARPCSFPTAADRCSHGGVPAEGGETRAEGAVSHPQHRYTATLSPTFLTD